MSIKLPKVAPIVALLIATLSIGATFYHYVEKMPWIDALYFCVMTLTTVGGGGSVYPTTDPGKIFTMVYILFGVAIIASAANYLVHRVLDMKLPNLKEKAKVAHHNKATEKPSA